MPMERKYVLYAGFCAGFLKDFTDSFWVSDEYGPYVHLFGPDGSLIRSIQPPSAILPYQSVQGSSKPVLNFTASVDPTTGRASNQGIYLCHRTQKLRFKIDSRNSFQALKGKDQYFKENLIPPTSEQFND